MPCNCEEMSGHTEMGIGSVRHGVGDQAIAVLHQRVAYKAQLAGRLAFVKQRAVWISAGFVRLVPA
jgi:hypothetical protein